MYKTICLIEKINRTIKNKITFFFLKLKYGKRINIGKNVKFRKSIIINISKNGKLVIGDNCFFNSYCSINCQNEIIIGNDNLFGENVKIYDHYHIFNDMRVSIKNTKFKKPIIIGKRNWFGSNCTILNNSIIGDNNVFQANTVINQNISSNKIVKSKDDLIIECIKYK